MAHSGYLSMALTNTMDKEENVRLLVNLTLYEAAVIKALRGIEYGKLIVFMDNGKPIRRERIDSELIKPSDGMDLSGEVNVYNPNQDIENV